MWAKGNGALGQAQLAPEIEALLRDLFPVCRSITGDGLRASLGRLQQVVGIELHEVPSGTPVLDWVVPNEWNVRDAYVANLRGERVIDFRQHNLHLVNYSVPFRGRLALDELKAHLHTLPARPNDIPYRTAYYQPAWGFCLSHNQLLELERGEYEVCVDTSLEPGSLTYGELCLPGETTDEVLISCHCCHPSLANDNLSGMALSAFLARELQRRRRRYTYRFLFIPGTIGAITWLALNESRTSRIKHGLVVACVGDAGRMHYKRSRRGEAEIDRAALHVLKHSGQAYEVHEFTPYGYDERQYCSPGFNLPVGSLTRTPHGRYPEYHTSADNLDLVQPEHILASLAAYLSVVEVLEGNRRLVRTDPRGEPQLGKRGLYAAIGGRSDTETMQMALLWTLNLCDGKHDLLAIAERAGLPFSDVERAAELLLRADLLRAPDVSARAGSAEPAPGPSARRSSKEFAQ
jgi:aminopeptidase-like protein